MDSTVRQHIHAIVLRTLHAHSFTRSSAQASSLLTDILERYLSLLALTAAQHAQHAGRSNVSMFDLVGALEEAGITLNELMDYVQADEARDLAKFRLTSPPDDPAPLVTSTAAGPSKAAAALAAAHLSSATSAARRTDALADLKASLADGIKQDVDDIIPLHYAPFPDSPRSPTPSLSRSSPSNGKGKAKALDSDIDMDGPSLASPQPESNPIQLPMSPVSNPAISPLSTPRSAKRQKLATWSPPPHVPSFLPPFPGSTRPPPLPPSQTKVELPLDISAADNPPFAPSPPPPKRVRAPLAPLSRTNAKSSYTKPLPYSKSSLPSSWEPPASETSPWQAKTPKDQSSSPASLGHLIAAYNVLQTETKPQPATNPSRLLIARSLSLSSAVSVSAPPPPSTQAVQAFPFSVYPNTHPSNNRTSCLSNPALRRYDSPDTLFASTSLQPPVPRHLTPTPSHPIPTDKDSKLPLPGPWAFSKPAAGASDANVIGGGLGYGSGLSSQTGAALAPSSTTPNSNLNHITNGSVGPGEVIDVMSAGGSYLGRLAKELLTPAIYSRTTRVLPPAPLYSAPPSTPTANGAINGAIQPPQGEVVTYNRPISAPWNSNINPLDGSESTASIHPKKKGEKDKLKGDLPGADGALLADAKLYATWDWTVKEYRDPLPHAGSKRNRIGSVNFNAGSNAALQSPSITSTRFTTSGTKPPMTNGTTRSLSLNMPSPKLTLTRPPAFSNASSPLAPAALRLLPQPSNRTAYSPGTQEAAVLPPQTTGDIPMDIDPSLTSSPEKPYLDPIEPYVNPYPAVVP